MESALKTFDLVPFDLVMIAVAGVLFVLFYQALKKVLFAPYLDFYAKREAATEGAHITAQGIAREAEQLTAEYDRKILDARVQAMQKKLVALNQAKGVSAGILEKADQNAQEQVRTIRWQMAQEIEKIRQEALREVEPLAQALAQKVQQPTQQKVVIQ